MVTMTAFRWRLEWDTLRENVRLSIPAVHTGDLQGKPSVLVVPLNSKNKYQIHVYDDENSPKTILVKGAPKSLFVRCFPPLLNVRTRDVIKL